MEHVIIELVYLNCTDAITKITLRTLSRGINEQLPPLDTYINCVGNARLAKRMLQAWKQNKRPRTEPLRVLTWNRRTRAPRTDDTPVLGCV